MRKELRGELLFWIAGAFGLLVIIYCFYAIIAEGISSNVVGAIIIYSFLVGGGGVSQGYSRGSGKKGTTAFLSYVSKD